MKAKPDFTLIGITRQLSAMGADKYEVGIFDRERDVMIPRFWSPDTIYKSIGFLKRQNVDGRDIFIRPAGSVGLVFFDDLNRGILKQLEVDGLKPAIIVQSSPDNFHGWLRVSEVPIPEELATAVSKVFAKRYGGDQNSADWRHYGRLAGFTNRKPKYINDAGKSPFVTLYDGNGKLAPNAGNLLADAKAYLVDMQEKEQSRLAELSRAAAIHRAANKDKANPGEFYNSELRGIYKRFGVAMNTSKADWMIVNKMLLMGYSREEIYFVLVEHSPAVEKRGKYSERYITVTLDEAIGSVVL